MKLVGSVRNAANCGLPRIAVLARASVLTNSLRFPVQPCEKRHEMLHNTQACGLAGGTDSSLEQLLTPPPAVPLPNQRECRFSVVFNADAVVVITLMISQ